MKAFIIIHFLYIELNIYKRCLYSIFKSNYISKSLIFMFQAGNETKYLIWEVFPFLKR